MSKFPGDDPVEVLPPQSRVERQAGLNGPSGSPTSSPGAPPGGRLVSAPTPIASMAFPCGCTVAYGDKRCPHGSYFGPPAPKPKRRHLRIVKRERPS